MAEVRKFTAVEVPEDDPEPSKFETLQMSAAASALALGLKTLSQRAVAGAKTLFTLASVGSAFWLWSVTPNPSPTQIVSLTIYALFILAANYIVRRI